MNKFFNARDSNRYVVMLDMNAQVYLVIIHYLLTAVNKLQQHHYATHMTGNDNCFFLLQLCQ